MRRQKKYRRSYQPKSQLPTLIIMCIALLAILFFGKIFSETLARTFVDDVEQVDVLPTHLSAITTEQDAHAAAIEEDATATSCEIIGLAFRGSALKLLALLVNER